jgi:Fic family protein
VNLVSSSVGWNFFAIALRVSAELAVATARRNFAVFQEDRDRLKALGRQAPAAAMMREALQTKPLATIAALLKATGLTTPIVTQAIRTLEREQIVREITGRARGRIYAYTRYLDALNAESG